MDAACRNIDFSEGKLHLGTYDPTWKMKMDASGFHVVPASPAASTVAPASPWGGSPSSPTTQALMPRLREVSSEYSPRELASPPRRTPSISRSEEVKCLQAEVQRLEDDATLWKGRCLESQRSRAMTMASEVESSRELQSALERERKLEAHSLELREQRARANDVVTHTEARVQQLLQDLDEQRKNLAREQGCRIAVEDSLAKSNETAAARAESLRASEQLVDSLESRGASLRSQLAEECKAHTECSEAQQLLEVRVASLKGSLTSAQNQLDEESRLRADVSEAYQLADVRSNRVDAQLATETELRKDTQEALRLAEARSSSLEARLSRLQEEMASERKQHAEELLRMRVEHSEAATTADKNSRYLTECKAHLEVNLEVSERQRQRAEHTQEKADQAALLLTQRVKDLEDTLSVLNSRQANEMLKTRTGMAALIDEADKRADTIDLKANRLELALGASSAKERELSNDLISLHNKNERLEEANFILRGDLQDAIEQARSGLPPWPRPPPGSTSPGSTRRPQSAARLGKDPFAALRVSQELDRESRGLQLRKEVMSARTTDRVVAFR